MNTEVIKKEIELLIEKYNKVLEKNIINSYNEEMTKKDFILPLFHALGWDTKDSNEVTAEEKISKKRVDYSFRINGIPKFFVEAKSLKENLDNPQFIEQTLNYAWHKGCTWAVLTNFKVLKIFNAEWKTTSPLLNELKTISFNEFINRFDELYLLSKESFKQGLLDKEAEKWGKRSKKIPVDKQLLNDFTRFRELLSKNITNINHTQSITEDELDEAVQKILDRLIFIRNCEDRELEEKKLISTLRQWKSEGKKLLIEKLRDIFKYFNEQYNSKIFAEHLCDCLNIDDNILEEIIVGLHHTKDNSVYYDFSAIDADILGNIYEQYLGNILKKTSRRAKLTESHIHRKEQGIYYTPTYIVDYIVRNTLGELLKNKKTNVEKIRVLDPACGSGSFLIKAYDVLYQYYLKNNKNHSQIQMDFRNGDTFTTKTKIIENNIFGVDIDKQAVEIAQLNLFLKIAERGRKLPFLHNNIKCGNSLIDDYSVAGDKAFKWEDEFKEIMQEGGFDVVIGNPPYITLRGKEKIPTENKILEYYKKTFQSAEYKLNTFAMFIERAIILLKEGGYLGFIIPDRLLNNEYFKKIRKIILDKCRILNIVDLKNIVFQDVIADTIIIILQKEKNRKKREANEIKIVKNIENLEENKYTLYSFPQKEYLINEENVFIINLSQKSIGLFKKIEKNSYFIGDLFKIYVGIVTGDNSKFISNKRINSKYKPILIGRDIRRYGFEMKSRYVLFDENQLWSNTDKRVYEAPQKILIRKTGINIIACLDTEKHYTEQTVYNLIPKKENLNLKYILAILNSKLINFYYRKKLITNIKSFPYIKGIHIAKFPIKLDNPKQKEIIPLVNKILFLNQQLNQIGDKKTDKRADIEREIKKTDEQINDLVYKIYGINNSERKIIEESLNE